MTITIEDKSFFEFFDSILDNKTEKIIINLILEDKEGDEVVEEILNNLQGQNMDRKAERRS